MCRGETLLTFRWACLVQVCPAVVPQFFTNSALQSQYATHAHAFLLSFFVTVEKKRFVKPTPKREVARWNRAGGTSFLRISSSPLCTMLFVTQRNHRVDTGGAAGGDIGSEDCD